MILLMDNGSKHTPQLKAYLKSRKIRYELASKRSRMKHLMSHRYKGVILSGGPLLFDNAICIQDIKMNFAVLLDVNVPILGICLGHQTIGEAYGSRVDKMKNRVYRMESIKILKKTRLFTGIKSPVNMHEFHTDCVYDLPYNFEHTATSKSCKFEGIQHKKKHIYGTQFHPEACDEGWKILDNFMKICKINLPKNTK